MKKVSDNMATESFVNESVWELKLLLSHTGSSGLKYGLLIPIHQIVFAFFCFFFVCVPENKGIVTKAIL